MHRLLAPIGFLAICVFGSMTGAADDPSPDRRSPETPPSRRPYRDGPLTPDDFQATPTTPTRGIQAWTYTEQAYRSRYRIEQRRRDWVVSLTELEVWAVVDRTQSWNRLPRDAALLDHEQGHFDITQIFALEAQNSLLQDVRRGKPLQARGATRDEAIKAFEKKLSERLQALAEASSEEQRAYDKATENGLNITAQADARREHKRRLEAAIVAAEKLAAKER